MLKRKLSVILAVIAMIVIVQACRKFDFFSKETTTPEFTVAEAKEWYYGVFKKSEGFKKIDYTSPFAPEKSNKINHLRTNEQPENSYKKFPHWNYSISYNVGNTKVVEMPLVYEASVLVLPGMQDLSVNDRKKIANASLQKVQFIKKSDNSILVRIITLIPTLEYLQSENYDISHNTMNNPDLDFDGYMIVRNWQEKIINVIEVKKAEFKRKVKISKSQDEINLNINNNRKQLRTANECGIVRTVTITRYCISTNGSSGDVPPQDPPCTEWAEHEEVTYEYIPCDQEEGDPFQNCIEMGNSNEQCHCAVYGVGCPEEEEELPEDPEQCTNLPTADNILDASSESSVIEDTSSTTPLLNQYGQLTRTKKVKWEFYKGT